MARRFRHSRKDVHDRFQEFFNKTNFQWRVLNLVAPYVEHLHTIWETYDGMVVRPATQSGRRELYDKLMATDGADVVPSDGKLEIKPARGSRIALSQLERDHKARERAVRDAIRAFKSLVKDTRGIAEDAIGAWPGRDKTSISRRGREFMKRIANDRRVNAWLDEHLAPEQADSRAPSWRQAIKYALRDAHLKPGHTLKKSVATVISRVTMAWDAKLMHEVQAPYKDAIPEQLRAYLPPNIVIEVDPDGTIERVTDRLANKNDTLDKKFERQKQLVLAYNGIVNQVKADMASPKEMVRLAAMVTAIMMETGIRPGQAGNKTKVKVGDETVEVETFGATTLGPSHVRFIKDNFAELEFVGKAATVNTATLSDPQLLKMLQQYVEKAKKGGSKWIFVTEDGRKFSYLDLDTYFRKRFKGFKTTDLRKLRGTEQMLQSLREQQQALYEEIRRVAAEETEDLAGRVTQAISDSIMRAAESAQQALNHKDTDVTIRAYINPNILLRYFSTGELARDLKGAVLAGQPTLRYDPQMFLDLAGVEGVRLARGRDGYRHGSLGDLLEDLEDKMGKTASGAPPIWQSAFLLVPQMFQVDKRLSRESANWNHNLATVFRNAQRADRKGKFQQIASRFDAADWLKRGKEPLAEIAGIDRKLAADLTDFLNRAAFAWKRASSRRVAFRVRYP